MRNCRLALSTTSNQNLFAGARLQACQKAVLTLTFALGGLVLGTVRRKSHTAEGYLRRPSAHISIPQHRSRHGQDR